MMSINTAFDELRYKAAGDEGFVVVVVVVVVTVVDVVRTCFSIFDRQDYVSLLEARG